MISIAQTVNQLFVRTGEYVGRYGGEEFLVLLGNANYEQALIAAERIQQSMIKAHYPHQYSEIADHVTLSQGVISLTPNGTESIANIYNLADEALYQAKHQGRNCFISYDVTNAALS